MFKGTQIIHKYNIQVIVLKERGIILNFKCLNSKRRVVATSYGRPSAAAPHGNNVILN